MHRGLIFCFLFRHFTTYLFVFQFPFTAFSEKYKGARESNFKRNRKSQKPQFLVKESAFLYELEKLGNDTNSQEKKQSTKKNEG
jgi:hypothetical protein